MKFASFFPYPYQESYLSIHYSKHANLLFVHSIPLSSWFDIIATMSKKYQNESREFFSKVDLDKQCHGKCLEILFLLRTFNYKHH